MLDGLNLCRTSSCFAFRRQSKSAPTECCWINGRISGVTFPVVELGCPESSTKPFAVLQVIVRLRSIQIYVQE